MGFLRKMFTSVRHEPDTPKPAGERNFQLQEVGFHGDHYQDQVCSFDYIRGSIREGLKYDLYYPAYRERTSEHHVLRGWGLIAWGEGRKVEWSDELKGAICLTR